MIRKNESVDRFFLTINIILLVIGFTIFLSASLGILANDSAQFSSIVFKQVFFGIILGLVACFIFSRINYKILKKYSLAIFIFSAILTILVFIPHIGATINGARRWIILWGFSFQPTSVLSFGFIVYWATWLSYAKEKVSELKYGILPLIAMLSLTGILLLLEPDTDSFIVLGMTGVAMLWFAGGKLRHVIYLGIAAIVCVAILALARPYVMSRLKSFIDPSANSQTSGYQLQQSSIAIGSGEMFGKGLGQSIQKYKFLPESISDSVFAVLGEELGFIGSVGVIILFLIFIFRGLRIAISAPDSFGGLLVSGIVILITVQSFTNIASILGIIPFSGIPLAFFSQGGTSMLVMLAEIGIVLNVSRFSK